MTPEGHTQLLVQAEQTGLSASEWLRQSVFGRPVDTEALHLLKMELQSNAVLLNQLCKAVWIGNKSGAGPDIQIITDEAKAYLEQIRKILQATVGAAF